MTLEEREPAGDGITPPSQVHFVVLPVTILDGMFEPVAASYLKRVPVAPVRTLGACALNSA